MDSLMLASPSYFASLLSSLVGSNHFRDYIPNHRQKLTVCPVSWGPISWVYMSEVMPMQIRGKGNAFATGIGNWLVRLPKIFYTLSTDNTYIGVYLLGASIPRGSQNTDLEILLHLRW